jgi:hypothetical protein
MSLIHTKQVYLSGPVFFVSLFGALWSLITLPIVCISHPCHLWGCARHNSSLSTRIISSLRPVISLNLYFIYASIRSSSPEAYSLLYLIGGILLSPFMSIGIALAAWTAACFWCFTVILGDPKGTEAQEKRNSSLTKQEDNDGKDSVMWCRGLWRDWLLRCLI